MKITFVLDKQTIHRTDSNTVVAGSRDYLYAHFALASPDWIAPITAIFGNKTVILNDDGDCKVPWEVIEHPGAFSVSAFCVSVHTAQGVMVPVEETPYDPGETPPDPSPDVYTQLTQMVQEALDTANSVREDANAGEFNGAPGPVGPYYEPAVNDAGDISWENNGGLPNPPTKNIKGPKGDAATIEIAGTETGNPGTDASVVNEGTKGDAKLRFTIPRGDEGKAATIEVGEVTASDPGSEPQVTNTGTENAAVLDFVLPRGQTGPTGQAATVEVESTITGQPGTQASVENVGTSGAAKLRFTIPQGAQGVPGQDAPAPQLTVGDVETVSPDTPADAEITGESPNFVLGLKIPQGETGATPNITAGEVEKLEPDQDPTASITGETPNLVLNLGIPQGPPGQDGVQINDEAVNTTEAWSSKKIHNALRQIDPNYMNKGTFGVQWDMSNPISALTRLTQENDPNGYVTVDITTEPVAAVGSGEGSSPFDNYFPWKGMEEFNVVDGDPLYKQGEEGFSRSQYDTMVYIPEFWYYIEQEGDIARYYISSDEREGFEKHPGSGRYVGRYTASEDYKSISGVASLVSITRATARENASAKGPGWSQYDYASYCAICLLYLVEYASFNSQEKIGNGVTSASAAVPSGGTDTMVYHTGRADGNVWKTAVQYRHIENPWGNLWQWVDGINMNNQEVWVCTDPSKYADDTTENYTNVGNRVELIDPSYGWITRMDVSTVLPWTFFPTASEGGSSVSYVCDYTYYAAGWRVHRVGGGRGDGAPAGLWDFYGLSTALSSSVGIGLRLLWVPGGGLQDIQRQINKMRAQITALQDQVTQGGTA